MVEHIENSVKKVTSSLADIAAGNTWAAAQKISTSLENSLRLGVEFLARVAHLDGIAAKIKTLFQKIEDPITEYDYQSDCLV
jgi:hypothetical protein